MRRPQGRHLAAARPMRRHRAWSWVLLVIFVLLVAIAGIGGYAAKTMYEQAKEVKAHEQNAVSMLSGFSGKKDLNSLDQISQKLPQVQSETRQANDIAHGRLWNLAAKAPYIGNDIKTVQGMTSTVDGIVHDSVPGFLNVVNNLKGAQLSEGNGQINLQPILQSQQQIKVANAAMQTQVAYYDQLPVQKAQLKVVRDAYSTSKTKLDGLAQKFDQISNAFQILPDFLGANQQRNYAVTAMTTSEARSSGGLIGSVGVLTTNNGKITVGAFRPNTEYVPYGMAKVTSSEKALFKEWGPMHQSLMMQDLASCPDTQRLAENVNSVWKRTPWGAKQPIDGVITIDPVYLQAMIRMSGNVTLDDGRVLTGDNTAQFLLNTIYKEYSPAQQDSYFGQVATKGTDSLFANMNVSKMMGLMTVSGQMATGRHLSMYAFDSNIESEFQSSELTAHTPNDETKPTVGVYSNEQNASKMDWYIHKTSKITRTSSNSTGARTYHVDYTMTNTMTQTELQSVPDYIRGMGGVPRGNGVEKTLIYAPAGGSISNLSVTGYAERMQQKTLNGTSLYAGVVQVAPGQSVTFSFDVTTSPKTVSDLQMDQSPMGWEDPGVTKVNY
ncbi:DUF4012 domain-containing protein [Bifidobacterium sp. ESL0798]|uniref:DUF4012 domain-containing protein n=1 Tax=Bifidobacterium sp. ESL0798 TaxID=2983235 RepID=UPI0023F896A8|nr:DUF4012 domain-containing protein [Bifidobacterium sp. ESL0798]WEV74275.1 DUF4012 domain-containing protein [Bifidobacterium sp. ESL0798]